MRWLVDACYLLAAVVLTPLVAYRALTTGKYRRDWGQRLGHLPNLPPHPRRIWVHAVSVGEVNAVRGIIQAWRAACPEAEFVISTTTDTGQARARNLVPDLVVTRYPLDFSRCVDRALDRIKPSLIVLVELEVWYQFVTRATARGIPVAIINGRLSERSVRRFGYIGPIVRRMFASLAWVGTQDETYAARFRRMGVPAEHVSVTGSVKWDTAEIADSLPGTETLAGALGIDTVRDVWVCGSTGPGEEEIILRAHRGLLDRHPDLQLVIVPRKPERFDEVADLIRRMGFACIRRSESPDGSRREPAADSVILGDTMGELRKLYCLASVAFVGRSLAAMGGSDAMEVAALAKPIVVGPHNENFAGIVARLQQADAIRILSGDLTAPNVAAELTQAIDALLSDAPAAAAMACRGREVVRQNRGATQRTLDVLMEMLNRAEHRTT